MKKSILITGSTDGIGLATARRLAEQGHTLLLHGRNAAKLEQVVNSLASAPGAGQVESYVADLSRMSEVVSMAQKVAQNHDSLEVLINNAGVFRTAKTITETGLDIRFAVNTIAPYLLTQRLLPLLGASSRVVNLSSAAQTTVQPAALTGKIRLSDGAAYAQSKLAITAWSRQLAQTLGENGPMIVAVNPGSMLGTKMVKEAYGVAGADIQIGADILERAALSDEFAKASGQYYDNDSRRFAPPHPDALDTRKSAELVRLMEALLSG